ncbi:MAG: metal-dependent hydrolase [Candidatus Nanoarchaeia archaeon]
MVSVAIHYVFGVLLARYFGFREAKYKMGLWAVAPDLDSILILIASLLGIHTMLPDWVVAHRGFSHSFLLAAIIFSAFYFIRKKFAIPVTVIFLSHLLADWMTPWKSFFFVPFSTHASHLGLVDIFDPFLIILSSALFGFLLAEDFLYKKKFYDLGLAYLFFLAVGIVPSFAFTEFNPVATVVSNIIILTVLAYFYYGRGTQGIFKRGVQWCATLIVVYIGVILLMQTAYAYSLDVPIANIEPCSTFELSGFRQTYEKPLGDQYEVGLLSPLRIEPSKIIPKYQGDVTDISLIESYYETAVRRNWVNNPVWYIENQSGTIIARPVYAKAHIIENENSGYNDHENLKLFENSSGVGFVRR